MKEFFFSMRMNPNKNRCRNFTEREKVLLLDIAKDQVSIIENKKTNGYTVTAKRIAWCKITNKFNAFTKDGHRTVKQLHTLYENMKRRAKRNLGEVGCEKNKTGTGIHSSQTTLSDEKMTDILQLNIGPFDSSSGYYEEDIEQSCNGESVLETVKLEVIPDESNTWNSEYQEATLQEEKSTFSFSPQLVEQSSPNISSRDRPTTGKSTIRRKKKFIHNISNSMIRRKSGKQRNEDLITNKRLKLLQLQTDHEEFKFNKTKELSAADLQLKLLLIEQAKLDIEIKKKILNND